MPPLKSIIDWLKSTDAILTSVNTIAKKHWITILILLSAWLVYEAYTTDLRNTDGKNEATITDSISTDDESQNQNYDSEYANEETNNQQAISEESDESYNSNEESDTTLNN